MNPKELRIIEESLRLFRKYGFQKVTMGDIAQAVGISRPTLYALFPNKPAVFGKFVTSHFEQMEGETDKQLKSAKTLKRRLEIIFDVWVMSPVSQAMESKEGRDIIANCEVYAPEAVTDMYNRIEGYIYQALRIESGSPTKSKDVARILRMATKNLKSTTTNLADLKRIIRTMILMTTASFEKI